MKRRGECAECKESLVNRLLRCVRASEAVALMLDPLTSFNRSPSHLSPFYRSDRRAAPWAWEQANLLHIHCNYPV